MSKRKGDWRGAHVIAHTVGDVTILRFNDERIVNLLAESAEFRQEVFSFVGSTLRLVVDLTGVEYIGSAGVGLLHSLSGRIRRANGQMVICEVGHTFIQQLFKSTGLSFTTPVLGTQEAAIAAFEGAIVACPIHECNSQLRLLSTAQPGETRSGTCAVCGATFVVEHPKAKKLKGTTAVVSECRLPTRESEFIRLRDGEVATIEIVGRLDLFASEGLRRLWSSLSPGTRILCDLRQTTEVRQPGLKVLLELVTKSGRGDPKAAVLAGAYYRDLSAYTSRASIHIVQAAALAALPGGASRPKAALTVKILTCK